MFELHTLTKAEITHVRLVSEVMLEATGTGTA